MKYNNDDFGSLSDFIFKFSLVYYIVTRSVETINLTCLQIVSIFKFDFSAALLGCNTFGLIFFWSWLHKYVVLIYCLTLFAFLTSTWRIASADRNLKLRQLKEQKKWLPGWWWCWWWTHMKLSLVLIYFLQIFFIFMTFNLFVPILCYHYHFHEPLIHVS